MTGHRIGHVDHGALPGSGQLGDAIHLLLQFGCWTALGGRIGQATDEILNGTAKGDGGNHL
ncbi:MAG: hypothetical protein WBV39_08015 [Rudaea sp.]